MSATSETVREMLEEEPQVDLTPMIDCVFLLLIFFMCMRFRTYEKKLAAELPRDRGLAPSSVEPQLTVVIRFMMDGDDRVEVHPGPATAGLYPVRGMLTDEGIDVVIDELALQFRERPHLLREKIDLAPAADVPFEVVARVLSAMRGLQEDIPLDERGSIAFREAR